jgi:hypothetical protein
VRQVHPIDEHLMDARRAVGTGPSYQPPVADEFPWGDWCADATICVNARTPEEATLLIKAALARVNADLRREGTIVQLVNEYDPPAPA